MDPVLLYELAPGVHEFPEHTVTINAFGARGPAREKVKAPGIFRIVIVGGSNVYGAELNDADTWPARLEAQLNESYGGGFEVWNFGVSAYVGVQMARKAEIAVRELDPDLVIMALSNGGVRAFLDQSPVETLFEKFPRLWFEIAVFPRFDVLPQALNDLLITHWRTYRQALLYAREKYGDQDAWEKWHEAQSAKAVKTYLIENKDKTAHMVFLCPAVMHRDYWSYFAGTGVPVFELRADDLSSDYRHYHPPPYVNQLVRGAFSQVA
jgi:hypothetical protein